MDKYWVITLPDNGQTRYASHYVWIHWRFFVDCCIFRLVEYHFRLWMMLEQRCLSHPNERKFISFSFLSLACIDQCALVLFIRECSGRMNATLREYCHSDTVICQEIWNLNWSPLGEEDAKKLIPDSAKTGRHVIVLPHWQFTQKREK